jgi:hypothetical protein
MPFHCRWAFGSFLPFSASTSFFPGVGFSWLWIGGAIHGYSCVWFHSCCSQSLKHCVSLQSTECPLPSTLPPSLVWTNTLLWFTSAFRDHRRGWMHLRVICVSLVSCQTFLYPFSPIRLLVFSFDGTGVWTQGFTLAKQVLYCSSHASSPLCEIGFFFFFIFVLLFICA